MRQVLCGDLYVGHGQFFVWSGELDAKGVVIQDKRKLTSALVFNLEDVRARHKLRFGLLDRISELGQTFELD